MSQTLWYQLHWKHRSDETGKLFIYRWSHFWVGMGIVANMPGSPALAAAVGLVGAFGWEIGAGLVMRYYHLVVRYNPTAADQWHPSVGDMIPWWVGVTAQTLLLYWRH